MGDESAAEETCPSGQDQLSAVEAVQGPFPGGEVEVAAAGSRLVRRIDVRAGEHVDSPGPELVDVLLEGGVTWCVTVRALSDNRRPLQKARSVSYGVGAWADSDAWTPRSGGAVAARTSAIGPGSAGDDH
ncbi:hypothetical protein GCM10011574_33250 [Microbispora bryophytorum]|uniref:Uncharacterized protein n=1 Tax=Microbispora bryophytorum TaxID=1460882 RepID=A0A8H9GZ15_9ACTN|nr:hypothetical protein GCM10011574_33250 [Microbispora bryophytorum]